MAGLDPELIERLRDRAAINRRTRERERLEDAWITAALHARGSPEETPEEREERHERALAARDEFYARRIRPTPPEWGR